MLILLLVIVGALCLSAGYLIGVRDIGADDVEAAGTWFGAIATLATVIIAGRVFLSDRLYQDYQVAYDLEREREEKAEENRKQLAQARLVDLKADDQGGSVQWPHRGDVQGTLAWRRYRVIVLGVMNKSEHRITEVQVAISWFPDQTKHFPALDPGQQGASYQIKGYEDLIPEEDLAKFETGSSADRIGFILDHVTLAFTQNDRRWIKRGDAATELDSTPP